MITLQTVGCPACHAPAEILDRFVLESTDGPVEHATVQCSERHHFTLAVERLQSRPPAPRSAPQPSAPTRTATSGGSG
jgi:hypothetical protein